LAYAESGIDTINNVKIQTSELVDNCDDSNIDSNENKDETGKKSH